MTIASRAVVVMIASAAAPAFAQHPAAESLFREGKQLLKKGDTAGACTKFQASEEIEPSIGTELNLADCRERNGQFATAWAVFLKAGSAAKSKGDTKRATEARRRAKLLEDKLSYLEIKVADDHRVPDLAIKRNDTVIAPAEWNQRLPIDPGSYTISVSAPKHAGWDKKVKITDGEERTVEVPALAEVAEPAVDKTKVAVARPERPSKSRSPRRYKTATWVLGATGIAGLGVGAGFALHARSLSNQANDRCPNTACLDPDALDANKRARSAAVYANAGFAVGGLAVVGTVVLWTLGRPRAMERVSIVPSIGSGGVGLAIGGPL